MRHVILRAGMLAGVLAVFATGAIAQHEGHHADNEAAKPQASAPTGPGAAKSGMMGDGMMMKMMEEKNQRKSAAIAKMAENMAAMQKEKDPAKLKAMMAQQSEMIEQMRGQMTEERAMMEKMSGQEMKSCPMASGDDKPSTK